MSHADQKSAGQENCEANSRESRRKDTKMLEVKTRKNTEFAVTDIQGVQDSTSNQRRHSKASKNAMLMK